MTFAFGADQDHTARSCNAFLNCLNASNPVPMFQAPQNSYILDIFFVHIESFFFLYEELIDTLKMEFVLSDVKKMLWDKDTLLFIQNILSPIEVLKNFLTPALLSLGTVW